jgi:hypothetical protein
MLTFFLAQSNVVNPFEPPPLEQPLKLFGVPVRDLLLIVGALLILALVLYLWIYLARRDRRRHRSRHGNLVLAEAADHHHHHHRRRRRSRSDALPRNPTLQETGGLPPPREDESEEPPRNPTHPGI